jgi:acyl-CoA synthetase (AMP-forming)/AMP-acid ligase II
MQSARNIAANTQSIAGYLRLDARDRALLSLPMSYCYGRSVLQTHLYVGGSVFLDDRFAFPRVVMEGLADEQCTGFAGVPLTFELLRRRVDVGAMSFPRLRYVTQAGGEMAPDTIRWVRQAFAPAALYVMYGQTEATARLSYLPPEEADRKPGSVGVPIPGVELRVVDDDARELAPGDVGQVIARGENVMLGYYQEPEATAAVLRNGWLWTGDLGHRDRDGFLFLRGRADDIFKVGGHRVSPMKIEHVLDGHPAVAASAVLGVADEVMGRVPVALVVPNGEARPEGVDLRRWSQERLPAYEVPVRFVVVDGLPRNAAGKVRRGELPGLLATAEAGPKAVP